MLREFSTREAVWSEEERQAWGRKKRCVAFYASYLGDAYHGNTMTVDPTLQAQVPTVEREVDAVLTRLKYFKPGNAGIMRRTSMQRSSRTDKGVHSIGTLMSAKVELPADDPDAPEHLARLEEEVNAELPEDIRISCVKRASKNFQPRRACKRRSYQYLLPAYLLPGPEEAWKQCLGYFLGTHHYRNFSGKIGNNAGGRKNPTPKRSVWHPWSGMADEELDLRDREAKRELDDVDTRLNRTVHVFDADQVTIDGQDFVRFRLSAESFVYHQIRKMVGSLVAVAQGWVPPDIVKVALEAPYHIYMPLAPPGFLFLDYTPRAFFDYRTHEDRHVLSEEEVARLISFRESVSFCLAYHNSWLLSAESGHY